MRHVHTERAGKAHLLIGLWCGIVLDRSRGGNAWELHFPAWEETESRTTPVGAQPMTPLSAKNAEVTGFLLGKS